MCDWVGFVARMDVTKQEDMTAFYRNLLDQTTDSVVKSEPAENEDNISMNERYMHIMNAEWCVVIDI